MSELVCKTMEELLHSLVEDGLEVLCTKELTKAGEKARVRDALAHMEKAMELYEQAIAETKAARINLSKAIFDIDICWKLREPGAEEMLFRVRAARAALMGEDGPGLRRRRTREKSAGETGNTDSSSGSE